MFANDSRMIPLALLFLSTSFAAGAAPGARAARLEGMSDSTAALAAPLAAAPAAGVPAPDTAHFLVPFVLPSDFTSPFDINDSGVIVGNLDFTFFSSSFVFQEGAVIQVDPPGAAGFSELVGVSNRGDAVGDYFDADGIDRGFLRTADGTIADLPDPVPDFTSNTPFGINSGGTIVGSYTTGSNFRSCVGYVLRAGRYQSVDIPGATCVFPNGINDRGDIVGNWLDAANFSHGFLIRAEDRDEDGHRAGARIIDITVAGLPTVPFRMNQRGEIVGDYFIRVGRGLFGHGFVRRGDDVRTLVDPAGVFTVLNGLNDGGVIVGSSTNGGFLAIRKTSPSRDDQ
jgi:hypothetical protein